MRLISPTAIACLAVAAIVLLTPLPLTAQSDSVGAQSAQRMMSLFDRDGDGRISESEFRTTREAIFDSIDANGDGALSTAEFVDRTGQEHGGSEQMREIRAQAFNLHDSDDDGTVTRNEFLVLGEGQFDKLDRDGDRDVTSTELNRRMTDLSEQQSGASVRRFFTRLDQDSDGAVTATELRRARSEIFEHIDSNADGHLTGEEFRSARTGNGALDPPDLVEKRMSDDPRFRLLDDNSDGVIDAAEYLAAGAARFAAADRNGDGHLAVDEFEAFEENR